jgi:hypothetical protein
MLALCTALFVDVGLFIFLGVTVEVRSNLPFPIMAMLAATPALGLVPWLAVRFQKQFVAFLTGAIIVGCAKLAGCVVARIIYGPGFITQGYVDADWRNAKLMISLFWGINLAISLVLLVAGYLRYEPRIERVAGT